MTETNYAAKIAALLAKAEGTDNAAEAEAFSAAAEKLMLKWGVTEAMAAEARAGATGGEPVVQRREMQKGSYHQAWMHLAGDVVGGLGSLRLLQTRWGSETLIYIIGHESDVDRFFTLFHSLKAQAEGAMKAWWKTQRDDYRGWDGQVMQGDAFKARRAFIIGFGTAVQTRLRDERRAVVEETTGADLVLVSRAQKVDDWVDEKYPKLRSTRSRMQGSWAGDSAGREAGRRADLGGTRAVAS